MRALFWRHKYSFFRLLAQPKRVVSGGGARLAAWLAARRRGAASRRAMCGRDAGTSNGFDALFPFAFPTLFSSAARSSVRRRRLAFLP